MAMNKSGLKTRIVDKLSSLGFITTGSYGYADELAEAIAWGVIDEITTNAKCSGVDSNGDTHDAVGIV